MDLENIIMALAVAGFVIGAAHLALIIALRVMT
jgi:hypothetical protein